MTDNLNMREAAFEVYEAPFRFEHGYIFDADNQMVADQHETSICRVRGWGRISYMENAEALQDEVGAMIAEALTQFWNRRTEPAGSADQVNDAVEMVDDSPGIVWKVTFLDGSSCHYGVKSTAQAAAGKCGTIEAIELKDKRFRLVEPAGSAEPISHNKVANYARNLAMNIWRNHYQADSPNFTLLPDTLGVLTQIDNMVAGLTRKPDVSIKAGEIDMSEALSDLVDCTSMLMEWCVKNVDKWDFPQYDWTHRSVEKARELLAAKGGE